MAGDDVLFVFAHQDDEVGCLTRIAFEQRSGNRVWCAYLTDGATSAPAEVRDAESLRILARFGVARERIGFLADGEGRIADKSLFRALERSCRMLGDWLAQARVQPARIVALGWEGGHPDHDAAHLVALAVARELGVDDVDEYALYNGWRRRPGFFRVASFVPADAPVVARRISLSEALSTVASLFAYRSQRRTWIGLGPGFAVRTLARREERFRRADARRVLSAPHEGVLFYERQFGVSAAEMMAVSEAFREALVRTS
jgi:LmbE family N-acetylglucosaminyl deacetylase